MAKKYTLRSDELYYRDTDGELKLCLAQSEASAILTEFHESSFGGHWGRDVTISNMRRHFYWPTMRKDVTEHLKRCEACQQWSKWPKSNELRPTWVVESFDEWWTDIIDASDLGGDSRIDRAKRKKLLNRWNGPGTITWIGDWGAAEVEDVYGGMKMYSLDDLKPYFD